MSAQEEEEEDVESPADDQVTDEQPSIASLQ